MLCNEAKAGDKIDIDNGRIVLVVRKIRAEGGSVRLGFIAERSIPIKKIKALPEER